MVHPPKESERWKFITSKDKFDALKTKPEFHAVVTLSRAINAIRFVQTPLLLHHQGDDSPAAIRSSYNSLLFSCGLFVESYLLLQSLNRYFGHMDEFKKLAEITTKSKVAQRLLSDSLVDLRNQLVFHFSIDEIGKQLQDIELDEPTFLSAKGPSNGQVYYELADLCAIRAFSKPLPKDDAAALEAMTKRIEEVTDLLLSFAEHAELLIRAILNEQGWHIAS